MFQTIAGHEHGVFYISSVKKDLDNNTLIFYLMNGGNIREQYGSQDEMENTYQEFVNHGLFVEVDGRVFNTIHFSTIDKADLDNEYLVHIVLRTGETLIARFDIEADRDEFFDELMNSSMSGGLIQVDTYEDLPEKGNPGCIYITKDTGQTYYWDDNSQTYISTGTAGRTGYYSTTQDLPTTLGATSIINKSDLTVLVDPTVAFSEGSEVIGANAAHGLIISSSGSTVTVKTIMDATIDSFKQVATEDDLPEVGQANVLYAIKDTKEFRAWDTDINEWYSPSTSTLGRDLTVKVDQGNYKIGDVIDEGTSLENIIINMLVKTNYPKLTNPSATISATGPKLLECGSTLNTTFTITFNRGSINPAYGTSGYRSGVATGYILNDGAEQTAKTFSQVISETNKGPFSGKVKYAQGEQPLDDEGGNYDKPLPAGSVNTSNSIIYEFVNALWSNSVDNKVVAKHDLVSKDDGTYIFNFAPQSATSPEIFDVPKDWTITKIEMFNPLNGKWESVVSEFTKSSTTHKNSAGDEVDYTRYSDNRGYAASDRQIRITF